MSIVLTKAALAIKHAESNFQVVKFESHKPKKKQSLNNEKKPDVNSNNNETRHSRKDLDLKKIRHEVVKFGMSGFVGAKKEEAKIALAVSLGAKPPKREYVNYKELMQKRKQEKLKEIEERNLMISKTLLQSGGKKKKKTNNDVGHFLDNYGKVQKKDLKNNKKAPSKKKKK